MKTFDEVMTEQARIQIRHQGIDPSRMSITERADEIMRQQQYLLDEITEVLTALGGPYEKASWKKWKANHENLQNMGLGDLQESEFQEVIEECADVAIFAMNIFALCSVNPNALLQVIDRKQKVNLQRWESGY